ncbi:MAG TPA: YdeI/OmpD-associated family protein [Cyclobacteriaceae bacterium]|nr:YdeI/OmpD-associated family protein [Cyclobacteriaceae bacterium]HMV08490.1 YdeI/OmpD-associated family protein [Cyclobacteriaceae bacterium]HMV89201.1 YdeI/OmpD-associated family protein [Cyclobacteriaceae bacterium]HMX01263.1 YdeI/OmpD-associated family protein [Cyclobacteriaceae bacterium]HMX51323.1 YdeI/OmpD-associated family protein [Cyclobacteriaceae bacterium]
MEVHNGIPAVSFSSRKGWRSWLTKNHQTQKSVWLIIYHKTSETRSVYYDEAVEEAICFGWIDSIAHKRDSESKYQFFAVRKPKSNWSKSNRERAEKMIRKKQMKPAGKAMIDLARKTGTWEALISVQEGIVPDDLQKQFDKSKIAFRNFSAFPPSSKRIILEWIMNAKKPETRKQRIIQTVELAKKNIRANHYRQ